MKMKIFQLLDPRENRMPKKTPGIVKSRPMHTPALANPDFFVQNNPAIRREFAQFHAVRPTQMRAQFRERLQRMVDDANRAIANSVKYTGVRFDLDEASGHTVAVLRDSRTGEVLEQIPSDKLLERAAHIRQAVGRMKNIEA